MVGSSLSTVESVNVITGVDEITVLHVTTSQAVESEIELRDGAGWGPALVKITSLVVVVVSVTTEREAQRK
jgi:hypothetical protein